MIPKQNPHNLFSFFSSEKQKEELCRRLAAALVLEAERGTENEDADDDECEDQQYGDEGATNEYDEEGDDDGDGDAERRRVPKTNFSPQKTTMKPNPRREEANRTKTKGMNFSFRDIEDLMRPFEGHAEYPIEKWIKDFEEYADFRDIEDLMRPVEEAQELIEDSFKIMDISINDSDWLLAMQMQDEKLKTIHEALKTRKTLGKEDFVLKHGRVYRKEGETLKWVVPRTLAWRVIRASHDDMGHFGIEKTLTHLKRQFWFPKMRKKVTNYIKGCVKCAYHKEMKGKPEGELYPIPRVPVPFHTVHMDHLGPF
ncbi:UNVERIFIED_CONTAM: hypothetical protein PYX00_007131 [Menopon gallinae]|uniref:RNA-directed DNA polymerase n=1 Tax=Menopon gallinae TaxID=328185 RepID=A0AAW2HIC8_9NEOP